MNAPAVRVVLVAAVLAAVAGCSAAEPQPSPQTVAPPAPTTSTAPSGGSVDAPVVGVAYPFDLLTHCGIRSAKFGGHWWLAVAPTDQPHPAGHNTTAGTMTLISPDDARFHYAGGTAEFRPAAGPVHCS